MNTEQDRAFIEWRTNHDPRKYPAERDAFIAGWDAGRAALQSQPQKAIAYMTRNEEGDPAMIFFDLAEARLYCNPNEEPEPLVLPGRAQ